MSDSIRGTTTIITHRQIYTHTHIQKHSNFTVCMLDDKTLADGVSIRKEIRYIYTLGQQKETEGKECCNDRHQSLMMVMM